MSGSSGAVEPYTPQFFVNPSLTDATCSAVSVDIDCTGIHSIVTWQTCFVGSSAKSTETPGELCRRVTETCIVFYKPEEHANALETNGLPASDAWSSTKRWDQPSPS